MATFYTRPVIEGESFESFFWRCVDGFCGKHDGERRFISESVVEQLRERVAEAEAALARAEAMTLEKAEELARENFERLSRQRTESNERTMVARDRLQQVRMRVADWQPPSENYIHLKEFMLQQLDSSIMFDGTPAEYMYEPATPEVLQANERKWAREHWITIRARLERAEKELIEQNRWCQALEATVPRPVK